MAKKAPVTTGNQSATEFNKLALKNALLMFRALQHPVRKKMLLIMDKKQTVLVQEIIQKTKLVPAVVSQQLTILKQAKLVHVTREGRSFRYGINYPVLQRVLKAMQKTGLDS